MCQVFGFTIIKDITWIPDIKSPLLQTSIIYVHYSYPACVISSKIFFAMILLPGKL